MNIVYAVCFIALFIFVAIMAMRQERAGRGGSYEQRRNEWWQYSQEHMDEFRISKRMEEGSSEGDSSQEDSSEEASSEAGQSAEIEE